MIPKLEAHYEILVRWNQKMNLTTVIDRAEAEERHYGEGIFLADRIPTDVVSILDVGSGGGFPGAVIAAVRPDLQLTLLENDIRKSAFLKEATRGWGNVKVDNRRSFALTDADQWDLIVSRAVRIEDLLRLIPANARRMMVLAGDTEAATAARRKDLVVETTPLPGSERRLLIDIRQRDAGGA